jgi:ubiquinone/menaquinone biosynthesis C-methylase UbiE
LASEGGFTGAVLDASGGTGERALLLASLRLPVLGVDVAETALATVRKKAPHAISGKSPVCLSIAPIESIAVFRE